MASNCPRYCSQYRGVLHGRVRCAVCGVTYGTLVSPGTHPRLKLRSPEKGDLGSYYCGDRSLGCLPSWVLILHFAMLARFQVVSPVPIMSSEHVLLQLPFT